MSVFTLTNAAGVWFVWQTVVRPSSFAFIKRIKKTNGNPIVTRLFLKVSANVADEFSSRSKLAYLAEMGFMVATVKRALKYCDPIRLQDSSVRASQVTVRVSV